MKKNLLWLLLALTVFVTIWAFTVFFERYDKEVTSGYSSEARKNPFLAAKIFLEQTGVTVHEGTQALDFSKISTDETVFLSNVDDMILTQSQVDEALDWVADGGFLIVGVGVEIQGNVSILERFDIDPIEYESTSSIETLFEESTKKPSEQLRELNKKIDERNANDDSGEEGASFDDLLDPNEDVLGDYFTVKLTDDLGELTLEVHDQIVLNHPLAGDITLDEGESETNYDAYGNYSDTYELDAFVRDDKGPRVLQFTYYDGTFTALSSSIPWENEHMNDADHAFFLAYLIPKDSSVHFFYNIFSPSLKVLIKQYFSELLIALLTLLILWLWRSSLRVQVVRNEITTERRDFSEHLKASAEFLISKKQYRLLLEPIQVEITGLMRSTTPGFIELTVLQQQALLISKTKLPKETIQTWFEMIDKVDNQEQMIAALKIGNLIRNKL